MASRRVNVFKKFFFVFLTTVSCAVYSQSQTLKNIYIIVEPSATPNTGKEFNSILYSSFMIVDSLVKWMENDGLPLFDRLIVRGVGCVEPVEFQGRNIEFKKIKPKIDDLYYELLKNKEYSVPDALSYFTRDIKQKKWKGSETLLVYIGDVNFVRNGLSSHGKYLNAAWLTNERSIFVRDFLKIDNTVIKGISAVVFTRTQLDIAKEKYRENFIINLFDKAGMDVYYTGSFYNALEYPIKDSDTFVLQVINQVKRHKRDTIVPPVVPDVKQCQIIGNEMALTVDNCGG